MIFQRPAECWEALWDSSHSTGCGLGSFEGNLKPAGEMGQNPNNGGFRFSSNVLI